VTAYGASAYAKFYNRRLPTYIEWLYVQAKDSSNQKNSTTSHSAVEGKELEVMHGTMHGQIGNEFSFKGGIQKELYPATNFAPNKFGIRGLDEGISQWGHWSLEESPHKGIDSEFVVLPSGVIRQPWEAFEKVGFRCVQSARIIPKK
jgi:formylglycine-generating enzyme required for sulfatase activity